MWPWPCFRSPAQTSLVSAPVSVMRQQGSGLTQAAPWHGGSEAGERPCCVCVTRSEASSWSLAGSGQRAPRVSAEFVLSWRCCKGILKRKKEISSKCSLSEDRVLGWSGLWRTLPWGGWSSGDHRPRRGEQRSVVPQMKPAGPLFTGRWAMQGHLWVS